MNSDQFASTVRLCMEVTISGNSIVLYSIALPGFDVAPDTQTIVQHALDQGVVFRMTPGLNINVGLRQLQAWIESIECKGNDCVESFSWPVLLSDILNSTQYSDDTNVILSALSLSSKGYLSFNVVLNNRIYTDMDIQSSDCFTRLGLGMGYQLCSKLSTTQIGICCLTRTAQ